MAKLNFINFNILHNGCFVSEFTERYSGITLEDFLLHVRGTRYTSIIRIFGEGAENAIDQLNKMHQIRSHRVIEKSKNYAKAIVVTEQSSGIKPLFSNECFQLNRTNLVFKGWENYKIIGDRRMEKELFSKIKELGEIEVLEKKEFSLRNIEQEVSMQLLCDFGLNEKQKLAIQSAVKNGLYDYPRRISITELSRQIKIPRPTLHRYLQQAETKIIKKIIE